MLIEHLSDSLILTENFICELADTASKNYNKFSVPKKNGGTRVIYQPHKELKLLQRVIHDDFLVKLPVHPASTAYLQGASVKNNAEKHKKNKYLLRLDFVDFFKSITHNDILSFMMENEIHPDWNEYDKEIFLKLVCYNGRLTMGSVTSPMLSNLICNKLDRIIDSMCSQQNITYTRYADDIYLSTNTPDILGSMPQRVIKVLRLLEYPKHLIINSSKTKHSSKKSRMMVTGLTITNTGNISIGRDKKREIRSLVYKWDQLTIEKKKYLQGYLSYCVSVEPLFINSLCEKFSAKIIKKIQSSKL